MRFLLTPDYPHPYNQRMVRGLAAALVHQGQDALALDSPLADAETTRQCKDLGIDILLQINRFRPVDPPLPPNVRHVAWLQDVFPQTTEASAIASVRDTDLVYTLGDAKVLGLDIELPCPVGCLLTGVEESSVDLHSSPVTQTTDFSLCGYIPPPIKITPSFGGDILWCLDAVLARMRAVTRYRAIWLFRRILFRRYIAVDYVPFAILIALRQTVDSLYSPLRGNLDIGLLSSALWDKANSQKKYRRPEAPTDAVSAPSRHTGLVRRAIDELVRALAKAPDEDVAVRQVISYFARDYPRLRDRLKLVEGILSVSDSLDLYGPGWNRHEQFRRYHRGILDSLEELLAVYRRSRVNLANNTHGLGLHSRTLECMAVGGFIFMHGSPHDARPGGMHTSFEPGIHYGMYSPENLHEEAHRWLRNEKGRFEAGRQAAKVVREKHLWRHRAQQIIGDLRR